MIVFYTFAVCVSIQLLIIAYLLYKNDDRLHNLNRTVTTIYLDIVNGWTRSTSKQEPKKKRIYYIDENGQRRWRKND